MLAIHEKLEANVPTPKINTHNHLCLSNITITTAIGTTTSDSESISSDNVNNKKLLMAIRVEKTVDSRIEYCFFSRPNKSNSRMY